jgi:hypothetical protein
MSIISIAKLARTLQSKAYAHGTIDAQEYVSDNMCRNAATAADEALCNLLAAIDIVMENREDPDSQA